MTEGLGYNPNLLETTIDISGKDTAEPKVDLASAVIEGSQRNPNNTLNYLSNGTLDSSLFSPDAITPASTARTEPATPSGATEAAAPAAEAPQTAEQIDAKEKKEAQEKANGYLKSATESVRQSVIKDMKEDMKKKGIDVTLDKDGWPEDDIQKLAVHEAMAKRQGEIEDTALKLGVIDALGAAPNPNTDPQGYHKWSEDFKKGVDAALDAKQKIKAGPVTSQEGTVVITEQSSAPTAEAAARAPAPEAAPAPETESKKNTLEQAFKDATEYLLAPNKNQRTKAGTRTKEAIMADVNKYAVSEEGKGYKAKFTMARITLTAVLGLAVTGTEDLVQKAHDELRRTSGSPASR
ncbi:MAG: hypothetical protein WCO78_01630 [Candidatus Roizmanbacteria bacterium]